MTLTVDEIAEILNKMREESGNNAQDVEKYLTTISNKLEMMADDTESEELFRFYISELKKSFEDKSTSLSLRLDELETSLLENFASKNFKEDFEGVIENIKDFKKALEDESQVNSSNILSKISGTDEAISTLRDEFRQAVSSDLENSSKILTGLSNVSSAISDLNETFEDRAYDDFNELKNHLENLSKKLDDDFSAQKDYIEQASDSYEVVESLRNVSDEIKNIESVVCSNVDSFRESIGINISEIKDCIIDVKGAVADFRSESEQKLVLKLEALELLNQNYEASFASVHESIGNVLNSVIALDIPEQRAEIKEILDEIKSSSHSLMFLVESVEKEIAGMSDVLASLVKKDDFERVQERLEECSNIVLSLKDIFAVNLNENSEKLNQLFEKIDSSFVNLVSENNFSGFRAELNEFVQKLLDNSSILNADLLFNKEKLSDISERIRQIEPVDYSYDMEQLSNKIEALADLVETDNRPQVVLNKLDEVNQNIVSLKDFTESSKESYKSVVEQQFEKFEERFSHILTEEDFGNFRHDFADFIGKIIDNANLLQLNAEVNKEQIISIIEKLNGFNFSSDFENIVNSISEIRAFFENNSKMNVENIINTINNAKLQIVESLNSIDASHNDSIQNINTGISDLAVNIQFLRDFSMNNKHQDVIDSMLSELKSEANRVEESIASDMCVNFADVKNTVSEILDELGEIKNDFVQKYDGSAFAISAGFENVKLSLENIISAFESLGASLKEPSSNDNVLKEIENLFIKTDELKFDMQHTLQEHISKILDSICDLSAKVEHLEGSVSAEVSENLRSVKDAFTAVTEDIRSIQDEYLQQIKDSDENRLLQLRIMTEKVGGLGEQIDNISAGLREYVGEFVEALKSSNVSHDEKMIQRFLDLEAELVRGSQEYEQKLDLLQEKLTEFAHIVENSSSDTEGKIVMSLEQISAIKDEMTVVNELLTNFKVSNDEKFSETIAILDAGVENLFVNVNNINESLEKLNNQTVLTDNIQALDEKFDRVIIDLQSLKSGNDNSDVVLALEEKFNAIKDELDSINSDMAGALSCKYEDIIRAFEPIKTGIEGFVELDFGKILEELKAQLELSFMNFGIDMRSEFAENNQSVQRLEQAYKETFNRISVIEECVADKIQNSLDLLEASLKTASKEISTVFDNKFSDSVDELKMYISTAFNDTKTYESVEKLRLEILNKIDSLIAAQDEISPAVELLSHKIESLNIEPVVNKVAGKFEELSKNNDMVYDMLSALHAKVDVLAMSDDDFIQDDIDEIKNLIFEQRKYFEEYSDEKTAAIDKYLRDVLLKLENVDFEKNSEDIKYSITNALAAMFEQISFIEESEDIKDFVENKTDEISKTLNEVQSQLRLIANSGDDFDYTYTLQDVESDIARLRLAINNMSGHDFEGLSDGIKKIINSVEGLEGSLSRQETAELKGDIEKLNEDIISISSRTNKLLLSSDETSKNLNEGLDNFSNLIYKLEERINYLDNSEITERIEAKVDNVNSLAVEALNTGKTTHQVMMYMGEWIDSASAKLNSIEANTLDAEQISEKTIQGLQEEIESLREIIPEKNELLNRLEQKFEQQEERIERLENKLERILSLMEEKDDMMLNRKVDKIEKLMSVLGANIEKLASYVE